MKIVLIALQIVLSISLVMLILTQSKGVGLGRSFSGSSDFYKSRRGVEKLVFRTTIIVTALFLITSVFNLFVS